MYTYYDTSTRFHQAVIFLNNTTKLSPFQDVWRRRHYRVRRAQLPGQFHFSVVDNGVVSNEFWRILDCADDLSWAVFYYGGAASAAGTSYTGDSLILLLFNSSYYEHF